MSYGTWPANAPPWPYLYFPPFSPQDFKPGAASGSNVGSSRGSGGGGGGVSRTSILTPAIVAIVALLGSAFLLVSYYRVFAKYCTAWQIFWGLRQPDRSSSSSSDQHQSGNGDLEQGWMLHNSGLDEAIVRKIPVYVFKTGQGVVGSNECAVCLGEFEDDDELRLLPKCSHAFHVACIDMWLRSHSNCPLCRAFIVVPQPQQMTRIQHEDDQQPQEEQIQGASAEAAEEQQQVEHPGNDGDERTVSLRIETTHSDQERDASEFPDSQQQPVDLLRRSLSLELGRHHHHRRGRRKTRLPQMLRRSHSTGSIPLSYLISSSLAGNNPDSAEFDKNFSSEEYVVLNVELGCSSNSSSQWVSTDKDEKHDNPNPSPLHSVRKSRSFRASLMRRSLSAGRVFSFRSFGRSKSNTNALGERQPQV